MNPALPTRIGARALQTSIEVRSFSSGDYDVVASIWQDLERRFGGNALTCSWDWTDAWLRSYGDAVDHRFIVGYAGGAPAGIAMLTRSNCRRRGPIPINAVHIGTAGEHFDETVRVEYNRILVDPRHRRQFAGHLLRAAGRFGHYCNEVLLDGFSPDELNDFIAVEPKLHLERHVCYITDLRSIADAGMTVQDALRRHTAAKIRRSIRRLEEAYGPLSIEWAQSQAEAEDIFGELRGMHAARWQAAGQPGVFASERFTAFHSDLIRRLLPVRRILLARVRAGEKTIGCDYGFIERGRVLSYQWGIAQFEDARLSPGLVTGAVMMQSAMERGLTEYDWLAGDVLYKRELSTTSRELIWARQPKGIAIHVLDHAARAKRVAAQRIHSYRTGSDAESVAAKRGAA
ncbi:MAG: GNAT family N-acetyltransferase [Thermomicrobiales bacterium]|nr:GNAT family N-acetyltransferase [Thermomicrobiales bacterium]